MKITHVHASGKSKRWQSRAHSSRGFSILELLVATTIFVLVAGTAFSVFGQHAKLAAQQHNLSGVNIGLRNGMTQMEMDLAGAGGNLLAGVPSAPPFYFSLIINNNVPGTAATCTPNTTNWSYPIPSACFDSFTVLSPNNSLVKPCTSAGGTQAPVLIINDPGHAGSGQAEDLANSSIIFADDPTNSANDSTDASCYNNGDEILVIQFPSGTPLTCGVSGVQFNFCMNVVQLTKDAKMSGTKIQLQHNPTGAGYDPLGIVYNSSGGTNFSNALGTGFQNGAYIVDLGTGSNALTYAVMASSSNANDPQLVRCPGMSCTTANAQPVVDQVIGLKVGADLWNNKLSGATDLANYIYNPAHYCSDAIQTASGYVDCTVSPPAAYDPNDYTLVRAVRLSLIARTPPLTDMTLSLFQNGFDNGPYLVQQANTVVDLRNLSNVDSTN